MKRVLKAIGLTLSLILVMIFIGLILSLIPFWLQMVVGCAMIVLLGFTIYKNLTENDKNKKKVKTSNVIWHESNETPKINEWIFVEYKVGIHWTQKVDNSFINEVFKSNTIKRWAYVRDVFPNDDNDL